MPVERVEVLVEEPSMKAAMDLLLPKLLGGVRFKVHPSQCKDELLHNLPALLTGYRRRPIPPTWRIVVIVDRDDSDCGDIKQRLESTARAAGMHTRTSPAQGTWQVANRIAVEELEAWFFGDMDAVRAAYPGVSPTLETKAPYRDPDAVKGGTWEALERVLRGAGYFRTGLRKMEAARAIAAHMDPMRNRSHSFQVFRDALLEMIQP